MSEQPNSDYLDRLMRRNSFAALWPLFAKATRPAKELTESYSALEHLRPYLKQGPCRVLHIGDGAHARTAAMFALKTRAHNISVDPLLNLRLLERWRAEFGIRQLEFCKARIHDVADELNALPEMPVLVTFVHAHVGVDEVLDRLRWDVAFSLACCLPGKQLTQRHVALESGRDLGVLAEGRSYQVLSNPSRAGGFAVPESGTSESGMSESGMSESGMSESGMSESGMPDQCTPGVLRCGNTPLSISSSAK